MVSAEIIRSAVGVLGNIISLFLFLSPVPTFIKIWKKKSVEQFSPTPYLATLINCMVWVLYGLPMVHPHSTLVVTINGTGTAIELVYIILFLICTHDNKKRLKIVVIVLIECVFVGILALLVFLLVHSTSKRSLVVGIVCICFNIMMYASPLSIMEMVIRTKSVEYMPFFLSLCAFANGAAWSVYALIRFDPFILAPNGLGSLFAAAQLILYAVYYKSTQRQIAERRQRGEVGLSEVVIKGGSKKAAAVTDTRNGSSHAINGGG